MRRSLRGKTTFLIRIIRRSSGFTMIELMVVVIILAVLAAIATSIYTSYIQKAKVTVAAGILNDAGKSLTDYSIDHGVYPDSINFTGNCTDGNNNRVFSSDLCDQMKNELNSIVSYNLSGQSYTLTVRANDIKHTLLTLTDGKINY